MKFKQELTHNFALTPPHRIPPPPRKLTHHILRINPLFLILIILSRQPLWHIRQHAVINVPFRKADGFVSYWVYGLAKMRPWLGLLCEEQAVSAGGTACGGVVRGVDGVDVRVCLGEGEGDDFEGAGEVIWGAGEDLEGHFWGG